MVKYVSTYTKGTLKQGSVKDLSNDAYAMLLCFLFMPPTSKKLEGHIASGLFVRPSVRPSVRPFVTLFDA